MGRESFANTRSRMRSVHGYVKNNSRKCIVVGLLCILFLYGWVHFCLMGDDPTEKQHARGRGLRPHKDADSSASIQFSGKSTIIRKDEENAWKWRKIGLFSSLAIVGGGAVAWSPLKKLMDKVHSGERYSEASEISSLTMAGRGFDAFNGNPHKSDEYGVVAGSKKKVFVIEHQKLKREGNLKIPDGYRMLPLSNCGAQLKSRDVTDIKTYSRELKSSTHFNFDTLIVAGIMAGTTIVSGGSLMALGIGLVSNFVGGSYFSANSDYQEKQSSLEMGGYGYTIEKSFCLAYQLQVDMHDEMPRFTDEFNQAVKGLPEEFSKHTSDAFKNLYDMFGSHVITDVSFGARHGLVKRYSTREKRETSDSSNDKYIGHRVGTQVIGKAEGSDHNKVSGEHFSTSEEFSLGETRPESGDGEEWLNKVKANPQAVFFSMRELAEVLIVMPQKRKDELGLSKKKLEALAQASGSMCKWAQTPELTKKGIDTCAQTSQRRYKVVEQQSFVGGKCHMGCFSYSWNTAQQWSRTSCVPGQPMSQIHTAIAHDKQCYSPDKPMFKLGCTQHVDNNGKPYVQASAENRRTKTAASVAQSMRSWNSHTLQCDANQYAVGLVVAQQVDMKLTEFNYQLECERTSQKVKLTKDCAWRYDGTRASGSNRGRSSCEPSEAITKVRIRQTTSQPRSYATDLYCCQYDDA